MHTQAFIQVRAWNIGQRLEMHPSILQSSSSCSNLFAILKLLFFQVLRLRNRIVGTVVHVRGTTICIECAQA